jgi:hypothetical protein
MLWVMAAMFIAGGKAVSAASPPSNRTPDVPLSGPAFSAGGLTFTVPSKWQTEPAESPARAGQWRVPPLHGQGESGEVVVFFFGPGIGGTAKENIEAWIGTMVNVEGHPAAAEVKHHETGGLKISQVVIFGTYNQFVSLPGVPPVPKSGYGLLGAVIENPAGNLYWRFTGPEPLVTANLPLFSKVVDSVKPQDKTSP